MSEATEMTGLPAGARPAARPRGGAARRYWALRELTICRIREFLREPEALFWVFLFPVLLAVVLSFAFREKPPDRIPIGVVSGPGAAQTLVALARSPVLLPRPYAEEAGREALRTGKISLLVEPGTTGTSGTPGHRRQEITYRLDETRPDSRIARLEANEALQRAAGRPDPMPVRDELVTDPGSRYIDFLIPGLLGLNLMGTGIWSLAFSITTARSRRLLKRLVATPMRKSDYLLSQIFGRLLFLLPEITVLVGFGVLVFGVPMRGSLALLVGICMLGAMAFCGLGVLIATRVRTVEGVSGLANLVMLPMWLLSGVFFSSDRFPDAMQPLVRALPLTAINESLRAVMNEGKGLLDIAPQLGIVAAWGGASFLLALKIFRWK